MNKSFNYLINDVNRYYSKKVIFLEVRNNFDYSPIASAFRDFGWTYQEHLNVHLSLSENNKETILS